MRKALFYKEWTKTRWFLLATLACGVLINIYMLLKIGRSFRFAGHEHLWDVIVNRNQFLFSLQQYYPAISGLIVAGAQMIPEINNKRLKLSLHLPLKESKIITNMITTILGVLIIALGLNLGFLILGASLYFPAQIIQSTIITLLPWYIGGILAYLLVVFCCFEPLWKRRVINILISIALLNIYYLSNFPGAYSKNIFVMIIIPLISLLFVYLSVFRFKSGVQPK